jgi:predicted aldo/keto reductase-like oxidoreductase
VRQALDRGITYFDTAESYSGGQAETTLGRALRGVRERVVIASKVKAEADASVDSLMQRLEESLRRLQTDRIDVYFNHAVNHPRRMENPAWAEFTEKAKAQGKIRWRGMSGHGGRLIECLDFAVDRDLVDVVLVAFHFGQDPSFYERMTKGMDFVALQPELPRVLAKAKQKGVGVVAMKTLRGARLNDLRPYEAGGATFAQAAFRWVLSHPDVDSLVVTMRERAQIDEYLGASGWTRPRAGDLSLLATYERLNGSAQCRYGCSACTRSCPSTVAIPEVLRARMYAADYGDAALGRETYADLGLGAQACLTCAERSCACPFGLPVAELTRSAHRLLS